MYSYFTALNPSRPAASQIVAQRHLLGEGDSDFRWLHPHFLALLVNILLPVDGKRKLDRFSADPPSLYRNCAHDPFYKAMS
jgi:hypothetical protein